jgi:hypothetical protein
VRVLATCLALVLYVIGWVAGIVAVAVRWVWSAVAVGWDDAHALTRREPPRPHLRPVPAWPAEGSG